MNVAFTIFVGNVFAAECVQEVTEEHTADGMILTSRIPD